jgi:hypothetical protein
MKEYEGSPQPPHTTVVNLVIYSFSDELDTIHALAKARSLCLAYLFCNQHHKYSVDRIKNVISSDACSTSIEVGKKTNGHLCRFHFYGSLLLCDIIGAAEVFLNGLGPSNIGGPSRLRTRPAVPPTPSQQTETLHLIRPSREERRRRASITTQRIIKMKAQQHPGRSLLLWKLHTLVVSGLVALVSGGKAQALGYYFAR